MKKEKRDKNDSKDAQGFTTSLPELIRKEPRKSWFSRWVCNSREEEKAEGAGPLRKELKN